MSRTERFFALHVPGKPFVIANAWDAASARIYEEAGFAALATTSAGIAWSLGYPDGEVADRDEVLAAIGRIVRVARVPVSADLEAGYGTTPDDVARTFERVLSIGVVGANLEDYNAATGDLYSIVDASARIRAVRARADARGIRFFINARCDVALRAIGSNETRFERIVERLRAYVAAGADGAFVPGITDAATIERLVRAIDVPLNVLAGPTLAPPDVLARCGVARISLGSAPMCRTLGVLAKTAREIRNGSFAYTGESSLSYADCNALFTPIAP